MANDSEDLCTAVVEFLGFGTAITPQVNGERLTEVFGARAGAELERRVHALLAEMGRIEVDWSERTLASGGRIARNTMRERHPELCERALSALEWSFTWSWR